MPPQLPPLKGFKKMFARVAAMLILLAAGEFAVNASAMEILLGTDAAGTFSHFTGRAICRMVDREADGLSCRVIPAPDSIHNLTNLQGGSLDMALVDARMLHDATHKKGYFEFLDIRYDNLTLMAPVYDRAIVLVARADAGLESLDQLKGKRINAGASRSPIHQATELILETKGLTFQDFKTVNTLPSSLSQDSMAFCHGSVQAMLHIGVHPDSALQQLIDLCNAVLIDMEDADTTKLVQDHPAYSLIRIPETAYPTVGRVVSALGVPVALVASGSLDDQTVQSVMAVLDGYGKALQHAHPALQAFRVDQMVPDVGVRVHPGAAAYLKQR